VRELVAFVYPDAYRAAEVMATLNRVSPESSLGLNDAVCVTRDPLGNVKLHYAECSTEGASAVRSWRTLLGALVSGAPAGVAGGAAVDLARGAPPASGVDDSFAESLRAQLTPGASAVFALVPDVTRDRLVPYLSAFGGTILRTPLPAEAEPDRPG
jgi:uncharacterized membrane protein